MRLRARWVVLGAVVLVVMALGVLAFVAMEPRQPSSEGRAGPLCSPRPCTELGGWELYVRNVNLGDGQVRLDVSFKNHTPGGGFEAVSFRHTNPMDFLLHYPGDDNRRPIFNAGCPNWDEPRIERGAGAGPDRLCFVAGATGLSGAELQWTPDQGVFSATGTIPLE